MIVYLVLHGTVICWDGLNNPQKPNQPFVTDDHDKALEFKKHMEHAFPEREVGYEIVAANVQTAGENIQDVSDLFDAQEGKAQEDTASQD